MKKTIENKYLNFHVTYQEYANPTFWTGYWLNTNYNRTRISEKKKLYSSLQSNKTVLASSQNKNPANRPLASVSDLIVCYNATKTSGNTKIWNKINYKHIIEARARGLDCGVSDNSKTIVSSKIKTNSYSPLKNYSNDLIISNACSFDGFKYTS